MFGANELGQMYQVCGIFGFGFFLFTAVTARGAHSGGHGAHAAHGLGHHGGLGGHHGALGGGHGAAGAHGVGGAHGAAGAHGVGGAHGPVRGRMEQPERTQALVPHALASMLEGAAVQGSTGQAITGPMHTPIRFINFRSWSCFSPIFNPMRMASFLFYFGVIGSLIDSSCWMGWFTLIPALAAGVIGSYLILQLFGFMYAKLQSSSMAVVEDLIGQMAEVTTPIPPGRTGEITYVTGAKRYGSAAKAFKPGGGFAKGDKVMIVSIENSVYFVEPWDETEFSSKNLLMVMRRYR